MNAILFYLYIYLIGGVTFIPLTIVALLLFLNWYVPQYEQQQQQNTATETVKSELDEFGVTHPEIKYEDLKAGELDERLSSGVETYATGWLTVTTEFYQLSQYQPPSKDNNGDGNSGNGQQTDDSSTSLQEDEKPSKIGTRYSQIYKFVKGGGGGGDKNGSKDASSATAESDMKSLKNVRKKNRYFAVLKHGNLFLYKDDDCKNVQHVIVLNHSIVSLWPRDLNEGALFGKRTAICIMKKEIDGKPNTVLDILSKSSADQEPPKDSFFIYSDYNHEKEDWYFNLIKATKRQYLKKNNEQDLLEPSIQATTSFYKTKNMIELIQTLNSSEGQLTTKWLNALIGRIFLGLHNTQEFHDLIKSKIEKKLTKIKKPGFLDSFQIQNINVGDSGPFITFPKLKTLSPEGDLEVEANLLYQGGLTIQIATKANINFSSRFKSREVNLVLTVKLVKLAGQILIKIKPPPSNRIWYGFTSMPEIDLEIEPIVSARQLTYNVVTKMIGNKFKEAIRDSLVLPYMDEFPFYDTMGEIFRGGIWDKNVRSTPKTTNATSDISTSETAVNDEALTGLDDEFVLNRSGPEEFAKSPAKSEIQQSSPIATDPILKKTGSFSSGISGRSFLSHNVNKFNSPSPEKAETESINESPYSSQLAQAPEVVPRDQIPQVVKQVNPTQEQDIESVYDDTTPTDPSSDATSRMSRQMKKVFKNRNESTESVGSSSISNTNSNSITNSKELLPSPQISTSFKKLGKWYNNKVKDNRSVSVETVPDEISTKERNYTPPEMIRYRREKSLSNNQQSSPTQERIPSSATTNSSSSMFAKKPSTEDFMVLPKSPALTTNLATLDPAYNHTHHNLHQAKQRKAPPAPPSLPPRDFQPPPASPPPPAMAPPTLPPRDSNADHIANEIQEAIRETRRSRSVLDDASSATDVTDDNKVEN